MHIRASKIKTEYFLRLRMHCFIVLGDMKIMLFSLKISKIFMEERLTRVSSDSVVGADDRNGDAHAGRGAAVPSVMHL